MRNNSDHSVNTFATHSFNFRFAHHVEGVDANYTMGPSDVKVRVVYDEIKQEMHLDIIDAATEMKALVQSATQECHKQHLDDKDGLKACLVDNLMNEVNRVGDSIDRLENYRSKMSNRIRNYICEDDDVVSSEPLKSFDYYHLDGSYMVDMYLDTENAKIWTIDNFITEEECDLLVESTKDRLQPAGTVGADGLEEISSTRKAQQASYEFNKSNIRSDKLW